MVVLMGGRVKLQHLRCRGQVELSSKTRLKTTSKQLNAGIKRDLPQLRPYGGEGLL